MTRSPARRTLTGAAVALITLTLTGCGSAADHPRSAGRSPGSTPDPEPSYTARQLQAALPSKDYLPVGTTQANRCPGGEDCAPAKPIQASTSVSFVLPSMVAEASPTGEEGDIDWNTYDTIEVVPHARLSDSQQAIVAREFGMKRTPEGWLWSQRLRKALIPYFLHRYRLDLDPARTAIRIELKDRTQMRAYFFAP